MIMFKEFQVFQVINDKSYNYEHANVDYGSLRWMSCEVRSDSASCFLGCCEPDLFCANCLNSKSEMESTTRLTLHHIKLLTFKQLFYFFRSVKVLNRNANYRFVCQ